MNDAFHARCRDCSRTLPAQETREAAAEHALSLGWSMTIPGLFDSEQGLCCPTCQDAWGAVVPLLNRWRIGRHPRPDGIQWEAWKLPVATRKPDAPTVEARTLDGLVASMIESDPATWDQQVSLTAEASARRPEAWPEPD